MDCMVSCQGAQILTSPICMHRLMVIHPIACRVADEGHQAVRAPARYAPMSLKMTREQGKQVPGLSPIGFEVIHVGPRARLPGMRRCR